MLAGMTPRLDPRGWTFVVSEDPALVEQALGTFREDEGLSLILPEEANAGGLPMSRITLGVTSSLMGVGLTAAVSTALAEAGIACNVVAAYHHDHLFVPEDRAAEAMAILQDLSRAAQG
ncbi:ACT domain-containing protein [Histidinibacterium aquaticum]|uniref:ACT domain-containing protein n=2 Tax=Histidinibacterium aquaticum TaxID=2613962 RepID=A0A5J5GJM8_9RHOB|nr:ACT domain-containing protein [Histidinibacterium aquaticum]